MLRISELRGFAPVSGKTNKPREVTDPRLRNIENIKHCEKLGRPGFEPGTNRLKAEYSTVELATHLEGLGV